VVANVVGAERTRTGSPLSRADCAGLCLELASRSAAAALLEVRAAGHELRERARAHNRARRDKAWPRDAKWRADVLDRLLRAERRYRRAQANADVWAAELESVARELGPLVREVPPRPVDWGHSQDREP
jgi:hypothetical protein